jgi:DNA-directed RNA polymerase subunit RPC12/RpoP
MRYYCFSCGKSVTSELPNDSVIRAMLTCPECIEAKKVIFPEDKNNASDTGSNRNLREVKSITPQEE